MEAEDKTVDQLRRRVQRAAEGILENERLTAGLDDASANALLDWGVACAETIARGTAGLNDIEAEIVMSPRLRATRRLMRRVNRWVTDRRRMKAVESAALFAEMIEQASIIYGKNFTSLDNSRRDAFVRLHFDCILDPLQMVAQLRELLEPPSDTTVADPGEVDDQEEKDRFVNFYET